MDQIKNQHEFYVLKIRSVFLITGLVTMTSCFSGPGLFTQSNSQKELRLGRTTSEGVVSAQVDSNSSVTQVIVAEAGTAISDVSISFPPGSLAVNTEVTVQEGASIASAVMANHIGIGSDISSSGAAVVVSSSVATDASQPFTLELPLPSQAALMLLEDPYANVLVLYKVNKVGESTTVEGAFTRDQLVVENNKVKVATKYFGVYQAVFTAAKEEAPKEVVADVPVILTKVDEKKLDPVTFDVRLDANSDRTATFKFTVTGMADTPSCVVVYDLDQGYPWDGRVALTKGDSSTVIKPLSVDPHTLYARVSCVDSSGRDSGPSVWAQASISKLPSAAQAPQLKSSDLTNNPKLAISWTSSGGGTGVYRYLVDSDVMDKGATETKGTQWVSDGSLRDGSHTFNLQEMGEDGAWSAIATAKFVLDTVAPSGSIVVNGGAAYTNISQVQLTLSTIDGVSQYITSDPTCGSGGIWSPFSASVTYNLPMQNSLNKVYVKFVDAAGNESSCVSGQIIHDNIAPPALASVSGTSGPTIGGLVIAYQMPSSIGDYAAVRFYRNTGPSAISTCTGTLVKELTTGFTVSFTDNFPEEGLVPGQTYSYRVCITDAAGNVTASNAASNLVAKPFTLFTTSATFTGALKANVELGAVPDFSSGLMGADARCQSAADSAALPGFWRALIADATQTVTRRALIEGIVVNRNGTSGSSLTSASAGIWSGALLTAVQFDQAGVAVTAPDTVWTGFSATGATAAAADGQCLSWSSANSADPGAFGSSSLATSSWAQSCSGATCANSCATARRLYCVNQNTPNVESFNVVPGTAVNTVDYTFSFPPALVNNLSLSKAEIRAATYQTGVVSPTDICSSTDGSTVVYTSASTTDFVSGIPRIVKGTATMANAGSYNFRLCLYNKAGILANSYYVPQVVPPSTAQSPSVAFVFVTGKSYAGNLGGLAGADNICQTTASMANLPGITWKAMLADSTHAASTRLSASVTSYISPTTNGVVASSLSSLLSTLTSSFNDFKGTAVTSATFWSNMSTGGAITSVDPNFTCTDWTVNTSVVNGKTGSFTGLTVTPTSTSTLCSGQNKLICVSK